MQNFIKQFLKYFLIIIVVYHTVVTILGYGTDLGISQTNISIIRDALWLIFVVFVAIWCDDGIKGYIKKWKKVRILFGILILFSAGISYIKGVTLYNMMIGIKYGFYFMVIFLTSTFIGYVGIKKFETKDFSWIQYLLMGILGVGFIWQILKIIKPDFFMSLGYGELGDFYYGVNPPIYYLTGHDGIMRWQGLFAGPNNYGYFLVSFLPLVLLLWGGTLEDLKMFIKNPKGNMNFLLTVLWFVAIVLTLSRSAIVGVIVVIVFLARNWIKEHKKLSIGIGLVLVLGLVGLSILKSESTIGHLEANFAYIGEIVSHPLGHGLGTSGPAIHHDGTMLPENYFMQIMIDVGSVGFILWCAVVFGILIIFKSIQNSFNKGKYNDEDAAVFLQWKRLLLGWIALLIMGLFLHVFEDSMVNYLFFCVFGLFSGYLSKLYEQKNTINFVDMLKK